MSLQNTILGFLQLESTTGYMLKKRIEGSVGSFWTVTQSQIYRELKALETAKLVKVKVVPQDGKPSQKVYTITALGKESFQQWLAKPMEPFVLRHPLLLRFVFAAELHPERLDTLLDDYSQKLTQTLSEYEERLNAVKIFSLARSKRESTIWKLSIENGITWCKAELSWIEKARKELSQ